MNTFAIQITFQENWLEVMQTSFMRNALIGGTIVALAAGLIGYFVIVRGTAFAAHALAHIGFPGATGAVLIGVPVTLGLLVFTVGGSLVIGAMGNRASQREVSTGTVLAFATALGVLFSSLATSGSANVTNVLFGNLLAIAPDQLVLFGVFMLVMVVAVGAIYRPLLFASVDPDVAEAKGVPIRKLSVVFMVLLALVVTMAVQVVGVLLLFALVITPAATGLLITARPARVIAISALVSVLSVWVGLVASAMLNLPPSFFIVSCATLVWAVAQLAARRRVVPRAHVATEHQHSHVH